MTVQNLGTTPFEQLLDCFLAAFEDYYVPMPKEASYYKDRWKAALVDYHCSYGMFDNGKLVGFIVHGIDTRNGWKTAFNTGTGVRPEYRGQKIVKKIYQKALDELRSKGIQKCTLEVITDNTKAVKAYESVGFKATRVLKCYSGRLKDLSAHKLEIEEIDFNRMKVAELPGQAHYSWDFQAPSLQKASYHYFNVLKKGERVAYFVIEMKRGTIAQFEILSQYPEAWEDLFAAIRVVSENVRIINLDASLKEKMAYIETLGLDNSLDQYEMELLLDR